MGREGSRGATQVTLLLTKIPVVMQQGEESQRHFVQVRPFAGLYPYPVTGVPGAGYSLLFACSTRRSIRFLRFCRAFTTYCLAL